MPWRYLAPLLIFGCSWPVSNATEIFKCVSKNGELTFSQTPCNNGKVTVQTRAARRGEESKDCKYEHRLALAATRDMKSGTDSSLKESLSSQQAARRAARAKELEKREACRERIRSQIDRINSRMRSGYSASQGIRLRERRRDLEQRLRDC